MSSASIYGFLAEFDNPDDLLAATRRAYQQGYRKIDAYSPEPIHGLAEAMGSHKTPVPLIVFCGGLIGALTGYTLQYWVSAVAYPLNIAGRPLHSWPSFIVVTFEMTILFAALSAVIGMLALNGLPRPYHPVFNVPGFALASQNRYFLAIEAEDNLFDRDKTARFLQDLGAVRVSEIAP